MVSSLPPDQPPGSPFEPRPSDHDRWPPFHEWKLQNGACSGKKKHRDANGQGDEVSAWASIPTYAKYDAAVLNTTKELSKWDKARGNYIGRTHLTERKQVLTVIMADLGMPSTTPVTHSWIAGSSQGVGSLPPIIESCVSHCMIPVSWHLFWALSSISLNTGSAWRGAIERARNGTEHHV